MSHWSVVSIKLSTQPLTLKPPILSHGLRWNARRRLFLRHRPCRKSTSLWYVSRLCPDSGLTVLLVESSNVENRPVLRPKKISVSPGPNASAVVTRSSVHSRSRDRAMGSSPVRDTGSPKKRTAPPRRQRKTIGGYVSRVGEFLPRGEPQGQGSRTQGGGFGDRGILSC